jgi:hypothetical protein
MQITIGKVLSLAIAITYTIFAVMRLGVAGLKWSAALLLPLSLIWFPEEIGDLTGSFPFGYINVRTPAIMVSIMGWVLLVGLPILLYLMR